MKSPNPRRVGRTKSSRMNLPQRNLMSAGRTPQPTFPSSSTISCSGILELHPRGYGFLRQINRNLARCEDDVFVPESVIKTCLLRSGVFVDGVSLHYREKNGPRLVSVDKVNGVGPEQYAKVPSVEDLTPTNPSRRLWLERERQSVSMRVLDLLCPFGLGQRGLIASPPRAGKTSLLKQIGRSIAANHPDIHLTALLVDERPEEVTDMRTEIEGEVFASSLDEDVLSHSRLSQLVLHRCQRIAETGKDVVLLVDSLTRLARACNKLPDLTGAIGAGGLNIRALDIPRQLFAAARSFKEGGSLTVIATVLIETENRMDEVIFREFKGTGNLDIVLNQQLADRRVWPAIDIGQSATRRVELLQDPGTLQATTALRNSLMSMPLLNAMKELTTRLESYRTNVDFLTMINQSINSEAE